MKRVTRSRGNDQGRRARDRGRTEPLVRIAVIGDTSVQDTTDYT